MTNIVHDTPRAATSAKPDTASGIPYIRNDADWQAYNPLPGDGLQQVFQSLWTRLNEAATSAIVLKNLLPTDTAGADILDGLLKITEVRGAYRHMVHLLQTAKTGADSREADLLMRLAAAQRDNHMLREQLREARA